MQAAKRGRGLLIWRDIPVNDPDIEPKGSAARQCLETAMKEFMNTATEALRNGNVCRRLDHITAALERARIDNLNSPY